MLRLSLFILSLIFMVSALSGCASADAAAGQDAVTFMNVSIPVPEGAKAALQGNEYYLYAGQENSIPYVMLKTYKGEDAAAFLAEFTSFMQQQYADLTVTLDIRQVEIGKSVCHETAYSYQVSGYDVADRRVAMVSDGTVYLFTSKEIPSLDLTTGNMLEEIVAGCVFLSDEDAAQATGLSDGYLYCQENGMPLYWLDFSGIVSEHLVLHCCTSSGDPDTCEQCLILNAESAAFAPEGIQVHEIRDMKDNDLSDCFTSLKLRVYKDGILMTSETAPEAAAAHPEYLLPSGQFAMSPIGVAGNPAEKKSHLRPLTDGPYLAGALRAWARIYHFRTSGVYLSESTAMKNPDGTFSIYLYDLPEETENGPREEYLRYTVDAFGEGMDCLTGLPISLMR